MSHHHHHSSSGRSHHHYNRHHHHSIICRFFSQHGYCKYGDQCNFSHNLTSLSGGSSRSGAGGHHSSSSSSSHSGSTAAASAQNTSATSNSATTPDESSPRSSTNRNVSRSPRASTSSHSPRYSSHHSASAANSSIDVDSLHGSPSSTSSASAFHSSSNNAQTNNVPFVISKPTCPSLNIIKANFNRPSEKLLSTKPLLHIVVLYAGDINVRRYVAQVMPQFLQARIHCFLQMTTPVSQENEDVILDSNLTIQEIENMDCSVVKPEHLMQIITRSTADFLVVIGDRNMKHNTCQSKRNGKLIPAEIDEEVQRISAEWKQKKKLRNAIETVLGSSSGASEAKKDDILKIFQWLTNLRSVKSRAKTLQSNIKELREWYESLTDSSPETALLMNQDRLKELTNLQNVAIRMHREIFSAKKIILQIPVDEVHPANQRNGLDLTFITDFFDNQIGITRLLKEKLDDIGGAVLRKIENMCKDFSVFPQEGPLWKAYLEEYKKESQIFMEQHEDNEVDEFFDAPSQSYPLWNPDHHHYLQQQHQYHHHHQRSGRSRSSSNVSRTSEVAASPSGAENTSKHQQANKEPAKNETSSSAKTSAPIQIPSKSPRETAVSSSLTSNSSVQSKGVWQSPPSGAAGGILNSGGITSASNTQQPSSYSGAVISSLSSTPSSTHAEIGDHSSIHTDDVSSIMSSKSSSTDPHFSRDSSFMTSTSGFLDSSNHPSLLSNQLSGLSLSNGVVGASSGTAPSSGHQSFSPSQSPPSWSASNQSNTRSLTGLESHHLGGGSGQSAAPLLGLGASSSDSSHVGMGQLSSNLWSSTGSGGQSHNDGSNKMAGALHANTSRFADSSQQQQAAPGLFSDLSLGSGTESIPSRSRSSSAASGFSSLSTPFMNGSGSDSRSAFQAPQLGLGGLSSPQQPERMRSSSNASDGSMHQQSFMNTNNGSNTGGGWRNTPLFGGTQQHSSFSHHHHQQQQQQSSGGLGTQPSLGGVHHQQQQQQQQQQAPFSGWNGGLGGQWRGNNSSSNNHLLPQHQSGQQQTSFTSPFGSK